MSNGNFLSKTPTQCWQLIENSASAHQRGGLKFVAKSVGLKERATESSSEVSLLGDRLTKTKLAISKIAGNHKDIKTVRFHGCDTCGGPHLASDCPKYAANKQVTITPPPGFSSQPQEPRLKDIFFERERIDET